MPTRLTIMGMTCKHCAQTLERALGEVAGVERARVRYIAKEADVYGEAQAAQLLRAVEEAGYRAELKESGGA